MGLELKRAEVQALTYMGTGVLELDCVVLGGEKKETDQARIKDVF